MSYNATDFAAKSVIKPIIAGGLAYLGDTYILKEQDTMRSTTFAGVVAASVATASLIEPTVEAAFFPQNTYQVGKPLAGRLFEISLASASCFVVNKYVLSNDFFQAPYKRIALIAMSDVVAEGISDLFDSK